MQRSGLKTKIALGGGQQKQEHEQEQEQEVEPEPEKQELKRHAKYDIVMVEWEKYVCSWKRKAVMKLI